MSIVCKSDDIYLKLDIEKNNFINKGQQEIRLTKEDSGGGGGVCDYLKFKNINNSNKHILSEFCGDLIIEQEEDIGIEEGGCVESEECEVLDNNNYILSTIHHPHQHHNNNNINITTIRSNNNNNKIEVDDDEEDDNQDNLIQNSSGTTSGTPANMENEKRMRREIANSNERRRMQSINAGFQSLRTLLPHHEGEKLSKAAILQQTAEYIYQLEQEKTRLLSQNSLLKRLLDQHDGNTSDNANAAAAAAAATAAAAGTNSTITQTAITNKKRKLDNVITMQTISDSSDEGLGSMSPEPVAGFAGAATKQQQQQQQQQQQNSTLQQHQQQLSNNDRLDLKHQLEAERRQRISLEEELQMLKHRFYPERSHQQYQHHEVIEHTDNLSMRNNDIDVVDAPIQSQSISMQETTIHHQQQHQHDVQLLTLESMPPIGQQQIVLCTTIDENSRPISPDDMIHEQDVKDDKILTLTTATTTGTGTILTIPCNTNNNSNNQNSNNCNASNNNSNNSNSSSSSSSSNSNKKALQQQFESQMHLHHHHMHQHPHFSIHSKARLQPILEAAIKVEPKVEVERIQPPDSLTAIDNAILLTGGNLNNSSPSVSPATSHGSPAHTNASGGSSQSQRMYATSRQNLETIVEAIRHLEGDHLFNDSTITASGTLINGTTINEQQIHLHVDDDVDDVLENNIVINNNNDDDEDQECTDLHVIENVLIAPAQDMPLALTTHNNKSSAAMHQQQQQHQRIIHADMDGFLQFKNVIPTTNVNILTTNGVVCPSSITTVRKIPTTIQQQTLQTRLVGVTPGTSKIISLSHNNLLNPLTLIPSTTITTTTQSLSSSSSAGTGVTVTPSVNIPLTQQQHHIQQQCRPGVIVVKQNS